MPSTVTKDTQGITCADCHTPKLGNTGRYHKGRWFCSYHCVKNFEEDLNEESPFWIDEPIK